MSNSTSRSLTNFTRKTIWAVPDSDQPRPRGDLISKRISNLGSSKRQLSLVEFQKSFEIEENSLCSFWSQVSVNLNQSVGYKEIKFSNKSEILDANPKSPKYTICTQSCMSPKAKF